MAVTWAPFLLDPSTPPEGKPARYRRGPDDPPSPAEERAARDGLRFARGRERTSYSQLALEAALTRARGAERTTVIVIDTDPAAATEAGGHWWDVAVAEISERAEVRAARVAYEAARMRQRLGD